MAAYLDPKKEVLQALLHATEESGKSQLAYAYQKTGLIITDQSYAKLSPRDQADWNDAIEEYFELVDDGIDPFTGLNSSVRDMLDNLNEFCTDCAVHFGSYVDRYRRDRLLEINEFSQVLVLSRVAKILLLLKNNLGAFPRADALILIRCIFEAYFVFQYLENGRTAELYFLARSSDKDGVTFQFKAKAGDKFDKSRVIFVESGEEVPSHISFYAMAGMSRHPTDLLLFDKIYARLSEEVHFTYRNWQSFWLADGPIKTSTSSNPSEVASLFLLSMALLADSVSNSPAQTKLVRRDARFLFKRARKAFFFLLGNVEEAPAEYFYDENFLKDVVTRLRQATPSTI